MLRLLLILSLLCPFLIYAQSAQVAIIIDDLGYRKSDVQALYLPGAISYAILPHTPYGKSLALQAKGQNNEVILHIPMEAKNGKKLGPGALTSTMNETSIRNNLSNAFAEIPFALGINNHMGSALTQNRQAMTWVMETLQEEQLYFIDSLTSPHSIAYQQAIKHQLPALRRHIFLDNDKSLEALTRQWNKALRIANKTGRAILIGHPYAESHAFLAKQLPKLAAQSIELIPASQLLLQQAWQEFEQSEQQANNSPNRYLLHNKNRQAIDNNEQNLVSNNSRTQTH